MPPDRLTGRADKSFAALAMPKFMFACCQLKSDRKPGLQCPNLPVFFEDWPATIASCAKTFASCDVTFASHGETFASYAKTFASYGVTFASHEETFEGYDETFEGKWPDFAKKGLSLQKTPFSRRPTSAFHHQFQLSAFRISEFPILVPIQDSR